VIPESNSRKISTFGPLARSWPGESLTEPIILEAVPLVLGFRKNLSFLEGRLEIALAESRRAYLSFFRRCVCTYFLSPSLGLDVPVAEGRVALPAPPEVTDIRRAVGA
jgi:hypothetical protein